MKTLARTIARLEHACSLAGQLDPRLLDSRELRLFVDAVVTGLSIITAI